MRLLIVFILALVFVSCNDNEKDIDTKENPESSVSTEKSMPVFGLSKLIIYKFKPGDVINYKLTTDIENSQTIEADSLLESQLNQLTEYKIQLDVDEVSPDNIADVTVTIYEIKATAKANGQDIKYDSKFLYSSRERQMFMDYEAMKNKSYKVRVSQFGDVLDITDVDLIIDEMLDIQQIEKKPTFEQRERFKQEFIQSGIVPLTEQIFRSTSNKKMSVNSSWEQRYPSVLGGFSIENIATFSVLEYQTETEDTLAKINASLSIQWTGKNNISEEGVIYNFGDPNISGHGTIFFNVTEGYVDHSETTIIMEMDMTMESFDTNQNSVKATKRDRIVNKSKLELI